jgi:hypothetical protein
MHKAFDPSCNLEYRQMWGAFERGVSAMNLLFIWGCNCNSSLTYLPEEM